MTIFTCKYCGQKNHVQQRGSQMNKYLHVCLSRLGEHLGYDMDEIKTLMKYKFNYYRELINKDTGETIIVYDETSRMDSKTCSEFIEKIIRFAAEHGCIILTPEEYYQT